MVNTTIPFSSVALSAAFSKLRVRRCFGVVTDSDTVSPIASWKPVTKCMCNSVASTHQILVSDICTRVSRFLKFYRMSPILQEIPGTHNVISIEAVPVENISVSRKRSQ